jgi:hypothetical protein
MNQMTLNIKAQADMHHAYLLGLQLMVATNRSNEDVGEWMFRLFRRQHEEKFLSSFEKLGLSDLPHAVACAKYHVMSNSVGGVPVEYMAESDQKAWVRFRYPRWMYHGPTICGIPIEVSRGFLKGWYAHNGVSLNNPRLGFVCVSEDMTGEFGLCGYFQEYDHALTEDERLVFAKNELPPPFNAADQPTLPADEWNEERLEKANRNYAMDYVRNGLVELSHVIGAEQTTLLGGRAARLIGLQYLAETRSLVGVADGDLGSALAYLTLLFSGLGDAVEAKITDENVVVIQSGLRIVRGLEGEDRQIVLNCWIELWRGALASFQQMKTVEVEIRENEIVWQVKERIERK